MSIFNKTKKKPEAPQTAPRDLKVINQEYNNLCLRAGEVQFNMKKGEAELFQINQQLAKLQVEYQTQQKAQSEPSMADKFKNEPTTDPAQAPKPA